MTKIFAVLALLAGVLALLILGTTAQAKPPQPPQPYVLGQEIIKEAVTPQLVNGIHQPTEIVVTCPSGKVVTGGGFDSGSNRWTIGSGGEDWLNSPIRRSYPSAPDSWTVEFDPEQSYADTPADVTAYAICVNAAAPTN